MVLAMVAIVGWQILTNMIWGSPPRAEAGPTVTCEATGPEGAVVALDGSGSSDINSSAGTNDDIVHYEWFLSYGNLDQKSIATGMKAQVTLPVGTHVITLVVRDSKGNPAEDKVMITVEPPKADVPVAAQPAQPIAPASPPASDQPITETPAPAAQPITAPQAAPVPMGISLAGADHVRSDMLGSTDPNDEYNLAVYINSQNACVVAADITEKAKRGKFRYRYRRDVKSDEPYPLLRMLDSKTGRLVDTVGAGMMAHPSLSTPTMRIFRGNDVTEVDMSKANWDMAIDRGDTAHTATFRLTVRQDGSDLLAVTKTLTLTRGRYDLTLDNRVENLTDQPMRVSFVQYGPTGMSRENVRMEDRKIVTVKVLGDEIESAKTHRKDAYQADSPARLADDKVDTRLAYAALANKFFACFVGPDRETTGTDPIFDEVLAVADVPSDEAEADLTTKWVLLPRDLAPHEATDVRFAMYWGPKAKKLLETDEVYVARYYSEALAIEYNYCCIPGVGLIVVPLARLLLGLLNAIYAVLPNYGVAIIIMVLIVRLILHPITKQGQVNMMKMQKEMSRLQPKIEAVKRQYADDRQKLNQEMMRVYREEGVNPAGQISACLPMFLQMPIWIALWSALNTTVELRHEPFVLWIRDMAGPDNLMRFAENSWITQNTGWLPLVGPITALNVLPIVLGVSMYLQQKVGPKPGAAASPEQAKQQKFMMNFMSIFFAFMFYDMPAGLNLYIGASNLFGTLEAWRIRKHLREADEKPTEPSSPPGGPKQSAKPKTKPAKRRTGWLAELQKKADEARKLQSKKKR